jgi:hypothetical protein
VVPVDNNAIFAYFSVRFGGELSIYFYKFALSFSLSLSNLETPKKEERKKRKVVYKNKLYITNFNN